MNTNKSNPEKPVGKMDGIENLSAADWNSLFDQSPDHIVLLDKKLCIIYTNRPSPGLTLHDLIGVPIYTLVDKDIQKEVRKKLQSSLRTGIACSYETEYHIPGGSIINYKTDAVVWKSKRKIKGLILVARDFTNQKHTQATIKTQAEFLDAIIDNSPFAMWVADTKGTVIRTNKVLRETLQLADEQLIGKYNVLEDENLILQGVMPQVKAVFKKHKPARFTIPWSGSSLQNPEFSAAPDLWIDVSIFPILNAKGDLSDVVCQWVDISEKEKALAAVQESKQVYQSVVEDAPLLICRYLHDGTIQFANQAYAQFFGKTLRDLIGINIFDLVPEGSHASTRAHISSLSKSSPFDTNENFAIRHDGQQRWIRWTNRALFNQYGKITSYQSFGLDITERKAIEQDRDALLENLSEAQHIAHVGSWDWDLQTNQETWSAELFRIFGRDPQLGVPLIKTYPNHYHPDDLDQIKKAIEVALRTGRLENEYRIRRYDDGKYRVIQVKGSVTYDQAGKPIHLAGTAQDITERRTIEQERDALLENLSEAQRIGRIGSWDWNLATDETIWSDELYRIYGRSPDMGVPHMEDFLDLIHPDDRAAMRAAIDNAFQTGTYEIEFKIIRADDGTERMVRSLGEVLKDDARLPLHLFGTSMDITELREAEQQLRRSEEHNRLIVDHAGLGIGYYDLHGTILRMNQKACQNMGIPESELLGKKASDVFGKQMGALMQKRFTHAIDTQQVDTYEDMVKLPTSTSWFRSTYAPVLDDSDHPIGVQIISEDISQQKEVQLALNESRRELETLMGNLSGMAYRCENDKDWTMRFVSDGCLKLTGYQPEDLLNNSVISYNQIIHPEDREKTQQIVSASLKKGQSFEITYRIHTADSQEKWVWEKGIGIFSDKGDLQSLEGFITDITERKQAESDLQENLLLLNTTQQIGKIGGWVWDVPSQTMTWTTETYHIHDIEPDEIHPGLQSHVDLSLACYGPEDRNNIAALFERCISHGEPYEYECAFTTFKGRDLWIRTVAQAIREGDHISKVVGYIMDITEKKQTQIKLEESEQRYQSVVEDAPILIDRFLPDGTIIFANKEYVRYLGKSHDEIIGMKVNDFIPEEYRKISDENIASLTPDNQFYTSENAVIRYDGKIRWVHWTVRAFFDPDGTAVQYQSFGEDITEMRNAHLETELSEARFHAFMDNFPAIVYIKNEQLKHVFGNKSALDFAGRSLDEYIGCKTDDIYPESVAQKYETLDRMVLEEQRVIENEGEYPTPFGEVRWKRDIKFPVSGLHGEKLVGGIALDLTDQHKAQMALNQSERQFHSLFTAIDSGFSLFEVVCDKKGAPINLRYIRVNPAYEQENGIAASDLIGHTITDIFPDFDPQWITYFGNVALTGVSFEKETFTQRKNKYYHYRAFSPNKGQVAVLMVDINQRKLDQIALQKRTEDLERFNRLSVGRELKMIDLKKEINQLCRDLGEKPRYNISFNKDAD